MPVPSCVERLAASLSRFPRLGLAHLPTPLEPMKQLSAHLAKEAGDPRLCPRLWVKREDCTGVGLGGNKLRKLDYVLSEAMAAGADTLVSGGVVQSNSQRQVAAAAARLGFGCHLAVYHGRLAPPSADYDRTGNALLNRLFGATLHDVPWNGDRNGAIRNLADRLRAAGRKPYVVPYGVSNPLGAVAYASTVAEIAGQAAALGFVPHAIVHCSGSAATQAGLVVGARACLPQTRIVGIDIDAEPERVRADVLTYGSAAAELLDQPFDPADVEVVAGHAGPAYGVPHEATVEAIGLGARLEALVLDPVYSGKGLAGLIALIKAGRWTADQDVVFVHTGGAPSLFAYRHLFD
jgi:L-cysteate sulfo-lyase